MRNLYLFCLVFLLHCVTYGQSTPPSQTTTSPTDLNERVGMLEENLRLANQGLAKPVDDLFWYVSGPAPGTAKPTTLKRNIACFKKGMSQISIFGVYPTLL